MISSFLPTHFPPVESSLPLVYHFILFQQGYRLIRTCEQATRSCQGQTCTSSQLLSFDSTPAYAFKVCIRPLFPWAHWRQLCVMLPLPQQLQWTHGHCVSSVPCAPFYGFSNLTLTQREFHQASRQFSSLIKSSQNMQNILDTFYTEVNSGRSHYALLIPLIKSVLVIKEKTDKKRRS